ncbi:unnamed protein product [Rangifer tarandus platyrhynchus]|uniref:Uncharacterized protein n=1 Tax=Rangifer tarandus platyrhynchus TaxID=3082113 RepID=A0ABN9A6I1_RANTA|nr:unnamed protein product [Rangifer tarandus platyrhynchus]
MASPPPLPLVLTDRAAGDRDIGFNGEGVTPAGDRHGAGPPGAHPPGEVYTPALPGAFRQQADVDQVGAPRRGAGRRRAGLQGGAGGEPGAQRGQAPAGTAGQGLQRQAGPQLSPGPEPLPQPLPHGVPAPPGVWQLIPSAELGCTVSP